MKAILLNALWRTGSTWLWFRFRRNPQYHCYYEPCNEGLLTHSPMLDESWLKSEIPRVMHHPELERPYYAEYPYLASGGVPFFQKRFAYERYCLSQDDEDFDLQHYFANLGQYARDQGRMPVFQPNRMLLRSRWFCARFHALHIFLVRNHADVWRSMRRYENQFFPSMLLCIVAQNQSHPYFQPFTRRFPLPVFRDDCVAREHEYYRRVLLADPSRGFACFSYFYALTTLYNLDCAEIVVDIDLISSDEISRERLTRKLAARGIEVDLGDCGVAVNSIPLPEESDAVRTEMERCAVKALLREGEFSRRRALRHAAETGGCLAEWVGRIL